MNDDAQLARRLRDKSTRELAFHDLYEQYGSPLHVLAVRMCGNAADAQDAVQETLVDVLRGIARFRGDTALWIWIYRIAVHASLRVRARQKRRKAEPLAVHVAHDVAHYNGPDRAAAEHEGARRILDAIARLPVKMRSVVALSARESGDQRDLTAREVGEVLGIPEGAVNLRLDKARARLAQELGLKLE